jgi:HlyD family secretion protein
MLRTLANPRVLAVIALVAILLAVALWPSPIVVDAAAVGQGPLVVTTDEEGETRVHDRFVVSAAVSGRLQRIELEPGDAVARGKTVIARILPDPPPLLDERTRAEAAAALASAEGALGRARAEEQRARTALDLTASELKRERELDQAGLTTRQALDARVNAAASAEEAVRAAAYAVAAAASDAERARARLMPPTINAAGRTVAVVAPVEGVILRRVRESEGAVIAGAPLVEVGDPRHLEIVSDLLSTDAVRIKPGMRVIVDQWGGDRPLAARVRLVEPGGFTKVSALGVEEQRVNVIMDFDAPEDAWRALGDAYRVEVRIVVWEAADVVKVPTGALFRSGDAWAAFVIEAGRARRAIVDLGQRTAEEAEVRGGLAAGQLVVLHPPDTLAEGARVVTREEASRPPR